MRLPAFLDRARCPACREGRLYEGVLKVRQTCTVCSFPIGRHDAADGPAFFGMIVSGAGVCLLIAFLEIAFEPPLWVHPLVEIPTLFLLAIVTLRLSKTWLIGLQYRHRDRWTWKD